jgi:hypothetical protein
MLSSYSLTHPNTTIFAIDTRFVNHEHNTNLRHDWMVLRLLFKCVRCIFTPFPLFAMSPSCLFVHTRQLSQAVEGARRWFVDKIALRRKNERVVEWIWSSRNAMGAVSSVGISEGETLQKVKKKKKSRPPHLASSCSREPINKLVQARKGRSSPPLSPSGNSR